MYFPVGWPKVLNISNTLNCSIRQLVCNRDKILFAVLTDDSLLIYYCKVLSIYFIFVTYCTLK